MGADSWAVLFDLDQTLVLTASLEPLRQKRAWAEVYRSFAQTSLPPGTKRFVRKVSEFAKLGVVTTSPRPYAERLLNYHEIKIPVVIAYHDVLRRKPNPECILLASDRIGVAVTRCICVGDRIEDSMAAKQAGAIPINITWDGSLDMQTAKQWATAVCKDWAGTYKAITNLVFPEREHDAI